MGQITIAEFSAFLDDFEQKLRQKRDEVGAIDVPDDFRPEIAPEMMAGLQGIALYLEAIADFRRYLEARDLELLHQGLEKAGQGNDYLNQALQLNWATYETYRQAAEEYMEQMGLK